MWLLLLLAFSTLRAAEQSTTQDTLTDRLYELAMANPAEAFARAPELTRAADRDRVRRRAFLQAAATDRPLAVKLLPTADRSLWHDGVRFADAIAIARLAGEATGRPLVEDAARYNPAAAIQSARLFDGLTYRGEKPLPYGADVLATAILRVPDQAVGLAAGESEQAQHLYSAMAASPEPAVRFLAGLARNPAIPQRLRPRAALLHREIAAGSMTLTQAVEIADSAVPLFHTLAESRLHATSDAAQAAYDRGLGEIATDLVRAYQQSPALAPEVAELSPRDLYLLLGYAEPRDEDTYFASIFDRYLARVPKLLDVIDEAGHLRQREFVTHALWFRRYPKLMTLAATAQGQSRILTPLLKSLDLDSALTIADALTATPAAGRAEMAKALSRARENDAELVSALLQEAQRQEPSEGGWQPPLGQPVLERYFFYDDTDGVESFDSFHAQYRADRAWAWEDHNGWVRITSRRGAKKIEIVANVPVDATRNTNTVSEAERAARRAAVDRYLGDRAPAILVHRGHAYHTDKTLAYLRRTTQLVYLGSCRSLGEIRSVVEASPQAQIIATRAVGTKKINDPMLKALNQSLLAGKPIRWPVFWSAMQARLGGDDDFAGYIPPHRNGAAAFMRTYDSLQ
jgi:hypothetical protein